VRYLFSMPYRQLEGFTRALNRLIPKLPSVDYSWVRRRILTLNPSLHDSLRDSSEPIVIAVDSSGVSVHKSGGWVTRVYGRRKRYIKIHFAVDVKTKEIVAMEVTTDDFHDSEALPELIKDASKLRRFSEAVMDGAYDNSEAYKLLRGMGVKPVIKPRRNARDDRGPRKDVERLDLSEGWVMKGGRGWWATVDVGLLKQPSQHSSVSSAITAWLRS
ncbi:MAG: transposase, partial [Candidatus Methanomethylicia archaeon]